VSVLIDAVKVAVRRPDRPLFENLSLTISDGERWGVVGINGTGKSTLLRVLANTQEPEDGVVRRARGVRIGVLDQIPDLGSGTVSDAMGDSWEAAAVLDRLGVAHLLESPVSHLSGGQAKRVALARALVQVPGDHDDDLLILDEPTNHLDLDGIEWLEDRLARQKGAVVLVSHDRHLLDRVCSRMLELDRGTGFIHQGGYQAFLDGRAAREERAASEESTRRNLARRELEWLRRGAPARTSKSKARIASATALVEGRAQSAARAGSLTLDAATARSGEGQGPTAGSQQGSYRNAYDAALAPRLGTKVVELHDVGHQYGPELPWLFRGAELLLEPGGRYGIVGANGSGKTTLLEVIATRLVPAEGVVDVGPTVRIGYYSQMAAELDLSQRVREAVAGKSRPVGTPEDKRLMEQFWFDSDAQFAPIGLLSGGERRRLQLLLTLSERPNVLLLDEPTNDLDLDTLRAIEEFLEDWPGTVIVISHDRAFLDRVVEEVLMVEAGEARLVSGGYAGWRAERERKLSSPKTSAKSPAKSPAKFPAKQAPETADVPPAEQQVVEPKKISKSTQGFRLRELEKEMARLERQKTKLESSLLSAGADHVQLAKIGGELGVVTAALALAEEQWLEVAGD
jgi:ABC transport system ATP-binding/permease protein